MADKKVTIAEVKKHSSEDDCWIIIHGKVYDVTKFIDSHPGGDILIDVAGTHANMAYFHQVGMRRLILTILDIQKEPWR
jgi:cytochrome b involved in lipid metabolism